MGILFAKLFGSLNKERRVLMLGLDAAGKTTVLNMLNLGEVVATMPTIGFNVETVSYKNLAMTIWDVGGQQRIRALWRHYYQGSDAVIFVVDSADPERLEEAGEELQRVLSDDLLRDAIVLVYANKQDLPNAVSCKDVAKAMQLHRDRQRIWHVQSAVAPKGDGLYEGLDWMVKELNKKGSSSNSSSSSSSSSSSRSSYASYASS